MDDQGRRPRGPSDQKPPARAAAKGSGAIMILNLWELPAIELRLLLLGINPV